MRVLFRGLQWFGTIFTGTVWDTQSDISGHFSGDANFDVSTNSLGCADQDQW